MSLESQETSIIKSTAKVGLIAGLAINVFLLDQSVINVHNEVGATTCSTPSPSSTHAVNNLLAQPSALNQRFSIFRQPFPPDMIERGQAETYGLEVPFPAGRRLLREGNDLPTHFAGTFNKTKYMLKQFGVTLSLAKQGVPGFTTNNVLTDKDLIKPSVTENLFDIEKNLVGLPKAEITDSKLKNVILAKNLSHAAAESYSRDGNGIIALDPTTYRSYDGYNDGLMLFHEIGHLIDAAECSSSEATINDPAFNALRKHQPKDSISFQDLESDLTKLGTDSYENISLVCADEVKVREEMPRIVSYSQYGLTSPVEDKAELIKLLHVGRKYNAILFNGSPILRDKFKLELARLYQLDPILAKYFIAVGSRPAYTMDDFGTPDCVKPPNRVLQNPPLSVTIVN